MRQTNWWVVVGRRWLYVPGVFVLLLLGALPRSSRAQSAETKWRVVGDTRAVAWPATVARPTHDALTPAAKRLLHHLRTAGYYFATVDSVRVSGATGRFYVRRGPRVALGTVQLQTDGVIPADTLRHWLRLPTMQYFRPSVFAKRVPIVLDRYAARGYPRAELRITGLRLDTTAHGPRLRLTLRVQRGPRLRLERVALPDDARTNPSFVRNVAGLQRGAPLRRIDRSALQTALQNTGLFASVGMPEVRIDSTGGATLFVPLTEAPPGTFDVVVGYLPPAQGQGGQLVGTGQLALINPFGGGRTLSAALNRPAGRSSTVRLQAEAPYVLGWPLRLGAGFAGEQRDSTFLTQTFDGALGWSPTSSLTVSGTLRYTRTRPGPAGARLRDGRSVVPQARQVLYGLLLRYGRPSATVRPALAGWFSGGIRQGIRREQFRRVLNGDTTTTRRRLRQLQADAAGRLSVPTFGQQALVVGGNAQLVLSDAYTTDMLYRWGGTQTLRGYDSDRFLGHIVARALAEYRYYAGPRSFAYAFLDLGFVRRPELRGRPATAGWHPGYGIGIRTQTGIGRVDVSYALNPTDSSPANGRIHLGLSVTL